MRKRGTRRTGISKKRAVRNGGENRRFAQNVTLGIVVAGLLMTLVMLANRWSDRELLSSVEVIGAVVLDTAEIVRHLDIPERSSVSELDLGALERRLLEHPFVRGGALWSDGDRIVVEIEERSPVAATVIDGRAVYLDDRGMPLPFRFGVGAPSVPLLEGVVEQGELDSARLAEAIEVVGIIRERGPGLDHQVSVVGCRPDGEYTLRLVDGDIAVRAGAIDDLRRRLAKLEVFLDRVLPEERPEAFASIDLRWRGQVVVRYRGGRGV